MENNKRVTYKDIPKQKLVDEYVNTDKSVEQVRHIFGLTHKTFVKALKYNGFKVRGRQSKYEELRDKDWLKRQYYDFKKSCKQIAQEIGATSGAVGSALYCLRIGLRTSKEGLGLKYPTGRTGINSSRWKGGVRKYGNGYIGIFIPSHPYANKQGCIMEHRLIMEKHLGRYLSKQEVVHHINGDKKDNRIENLELCNNNAENTKKHFDAVKKLDKLLNIINNCDKCKSQLEIIE